MVNQKTDVTTIDICDALYLLLKIFAFQSFVSQKVLSCVRILLGGDAKSF